MFNPFKCEKKSVKIQLTYRVLRAALRFLEFVKMVSNSCIWQNTLTRAFTARNFQMSEIVIWHLSTWFCRIVFSCKNWGTVNKNTTLKDVAHPNTWVQEDRTEDIATNCRISLFDDGWPPNNFWIQAVDRCFKKLQIRFEEIILNKVPSIRYTIEIDLAS
jgi:hypothetical protein